MTRPKRFNKNITLSISEELLNEAREFAKERGWDVSFLMREAIKKYMKEKNGKNT